MACRRHRPFAPNRSNPCSHASYARPSPSSQIFLKPGVLFRPSRSSFFCLPTNVDREAILFVKRARLFYVVEQNMFSGKHNDRCYSSTAIPLSIFATLFVPARYCKQVPSVNNEVERVCVSKFILNEFTLLLPAICALYRPPPRLVQGDHALAALPNVPGTLVSAKADHVAGTGGVHVNSTEDSPAVSFRCSTRAFSARASPRTSPFHAPPRRTRRSGAGCSRADSTPLQRRRRTTTRRNSPLAPFCPCRGVGENKGQHFDASTLG